MQRIRISNPLSVLVDCEKKDYHNIFACANIEKYLPIALILFFGFFILNSY